MKSLEWKFAATCLGFLCVLCASVVNGFALDREAFSFTNYDLNVQIDPEQHRLGVRGTVTLRNDSSTPQSNCAAGLVVTRLAIGEGGRQSCTVCLAALYI